MAAFHGKLGSVTFNTASDEAILAVTAWSINATAKVAETTVMAATSKTYVGGFLNWTAQVECLTDDAGLDPDLTTDFADGDGANLVLHGSTAAGSLAKKYSGTAIVTDISFSVDKNDVAKLTYSFQGSGALTEATDS